MTLPPFLERLGLVPQASERDVRRAYAQRLKRIDQQTDPAAFQRLREDYDAALAWTANQRSWQVQGLAATVGPTTALDMQEAAPTMPVRPPDIVATEIFDELTITDLRDNDTARHRLEASLDDERLTELEARQHFERLVAERLAAGWQAGHEFLFEAAVASFGWDIDHGRLSRLHRAGAIMETAIAERDLFHEQDPKVMPLQLDLMERVRNRRRPSDTDLARTMRVFDWLADHHPTWLGLTVGRDNIQQWDAWHAELPADRQSIDGPDPEPTHAPDWLGTAAQQQKYKAPPGHYRHLFILVFFIACFFGALVLGAYLSHRFNW